MNFDPIAITILLGTFALLIMIRTPIAFALGIAAVAAALYLELPLLIVAQRMVSGLESISLIAIPFFILAGQIMSEGRIAERLVNLASLFVGRIRGGLAMINCVDSMFFGGISGSAVADVSSLGSVMIPAMQRKGYTKDFAIALTVTTAVQAVLIPPSHNMIIYSLVSGGVSVGKLFLAGALPGFLLGLALMVASYILAVKYNFPREEWVGFRKAVKIFLDGLLSVGVAILIMGGIISGFFTASESAAIAVLYAFVLTFFVYRDIPLRRFGKILKDSVNTVAMVFLLIGTSSAFGWMMTYLGVPGAIANWMLSLSNNKYVILTLINLFLLFIGMIMDMAPAIVICTPILLPIANQLGVDPVHFGVILMFNLGIGLCTPPVGNALFVGCAVGKAKMEEVFKPLMVCYLPMIVILFVITFFPDIAMLLPRLFMK
ncbi:tripartite ATP-independent transporter DctM subunit [Hydrogenispora ethanolica]|uniref:Tripartite ATP-independent transporter DctM subunit n=1 Tax=Hydrogenispora ethanolica TaxID=1082276 RepID=A0A4R1S210_HYDET|nr:TRAP transporter large permease [Hydrogenispora ethanolica]TCL73205.1 tripartite ATP-independent transporter DctM subunit [Hydrogenispora ethanolica]